MEKPLIPHARKAVKQYMEEFDIKGLTSVISEQCVKGADVIDINVNAEGADKKALAGASDKWTAKFDFVLHRFQRA